MGDSASKEVDFGVDLSQKPSYSADEVAKHNTKEDCWIIVHGAVIDVTKFLDEHPGGGEIIAERGGVDATEAYDEIQHSDRAAKLASKYIIGKIAA